MTTTTADTAAGNPAAQLAELRTKLANLVGNATWRLTIDNAHPGHVLDQVLDRLTELAEDTTSASDIGLPLCCGEVMAEIPASPHAWMVPGDPAVHIERIFRCQVCDLFGHIEITEPAQKTYLLAHLKEVPT